MKIKKKRLGDLLVEAGVIDDEQLRAALDEQRGKKAKLGEVLIQMGITTEEEIADVLEAQLNICRVNLYEIKIPEEVIAVITDSTLLKKYVVMPYGFTDDGSGLMLAMADPTDLMSIDDLGIITGLQIVPALAISKDILATVDKYYGDAEARAVVELYRKERESEGRVIDEEESEDVANAPIVMLVKSLIEQAVRRRASDIHIEPLNDRVRIRNRVDGVLIDVGTYASAMMPAIIARVKILGGMDISEKRKSQDGRITQIVDRMEYDIRVSTLPTVFGEKAVLRLTAKTVLTHDKKKLGFTDEELEKFNKILANPNGIILVTGPTGSGKSTTLYTALSELNTENVNIVTVEDPVEANLDGVNQVQVNVKANLTFASALRSILRQDPDIIMIGEIRDGETANIAVTASITGHLVVSTLHTNSAVSSISRLSDMGVAQYLIADSTVGIIAQRLVRKLCTCKQKREATPEEKKSLGASENEILYIHDAAGCVKCNYTGYLGRTGVYEIMPITKRIRAAIASMSSMEEIEQIAIDEGMTTLRLSASKLVREGITTLHELDRITYSNDVW